MERYKTIIEDWERFKQACQKPAINTVRKNRIKAGEDFEKKLFERFPEAEQTEWNKEVYRLHGIETPGKSMLHWLGEYYVQEESATLPVEALNPQKGEKILDMAAAPGGKTTQIASKIENKGVVIANDANARRMKSLHANVYRTGSASVAATNYDGRHIPEDEEYDRILVDAPCSGEGDRARRTFEASSKSERGSLSKLQKQLLEKAGSMVKKGGTVVYSTCTIAPEENEEVVKHVTEETGLELVDIDTDIEHSNGVTSFEGETYGEEMGKTVRIYPHHFGSGVIYVAKFRK